MLPNMQVYIYRFPTYNIPEYISQLPIQGTNCFNIKVILKISMLETETFLIFF